MEIKTPIHIQRTQQSALRSVNVEELEFGQKVSDHMFSAEYHHGDWQQLKIIPFQDISLSPVTLALHYGQSIFEGMKAFRMQDGRVSIFRIDRHHERLNRSLERMAMPPVPLELFSEALQELVTLDQHWVPKTNGSALYLRPLIFASEAKMGVKISEEYRFLIVTGPVPLLHARPIRVKVERSFIRAARGGTGYAKCSGNYGGSFYPTQKAREEGYDQVIWTDAGDHEYFEESGTMNLFFVIGGTLVTPPLSDSILDGVTRDSLLQLAEDLGIPVEERPVGISEFVEGRKNSRVTEVFGAGTAAVVAPISEVGIDGINYTMPAYDGNSIMFRLKSLLDDIRYGRTTDKHSWNTIVGEGID
jgi:branched-chain amino acid aminotransferase